MNYYSSIFLHLVSIITIMNGMKVESESTQLSDFMSDLKNNSDIKVLSKKWAAIEPKVGIEDHIEAINILSHYVPVEKTDIAVCNNLCNNIENGMAKKCMAELQHADDAFFKRYKVLFQAYIDSIPPNRNASWELRCAITALNIRPEFRINKNQFTPITVQKNSDKQATIEKLIRLLNKKNKQCLIQQEDDSVEDLTSFDTMMLTGQLKKKISHSQEILSGATKVQEETIPYDDNDQEVQRITAILSKKSDNVLQKQSQLLQEEQNVGRLLVLEYARREVLKNQLKESKINKKKLQDCQALINQKKVELMPSSDRAEKARFALGCANAAESIKKGL